MVFQIARTSVCGQIQGPKDVPKSRGQTNSGQADLNWKESKPLRGQQVQTVSWWLEGRRVEWWARRVGEWRVCVRE